MMTARPRPGPYLRCMTLVVRHVLSLASFAAMLAPWFTTPRIPPLMIGVSVAVVLALAMIWSVGPQVNRRYSWAVVWGLLAGAGPMGAQVVISWGPNCEGCAIGMMIAVVMAGFGAVLVPSLVAAVRGLRLVG